MDIKEENKDEKKDPKSNNNDYSKLLVIAGPILVLFGVTKLIFFYLFFNIEIIKFLDFSEIITSFFNVVVLGIFFLLVLVSLFSPFLTQRV